MTVLYINGQLCDLPTDFRITLVQENLYFSSASTYTYDIDLPIAPYGNNAKIFVGYNRADKRIANQALPARLIVDNRVVLNGSAIVVGTSERSVRVQLLQGNSELNWKQRLETTYIDELDLGNVSEWSLVKDEWGRIRINSLLSRVYPDVVPIFYWPQDCVYVSTAGNVALTPIYNSETGEVMNPLGNLGDVLGIHDNIKHPLVNIGDQFDPERLAPQPKLSLMLTKILRAAGFTNTSYNDLTNDDLYKKLYIANSTEVWYIADMLPHITFLQFVEQMQALFDCVFHFVNATTVEIRSRKKFYTEENTRKNTIDKVVDSFNVDIEEKTTVADSDKIKVYSIDYGTYGIEFLGKAFDNVKIAPASELSATPNPNVFATSYYGHKVSSPYVENGQVKGQEVDHYQPSVTQENTTEEYNLDLVPVVKDIEYYAGRNNSENVPLYLFVPQSVGKVIEPDDYTIQELLDDGEEPQEKMRIDTIALGFLRRVEQNYTSGNTTKKYEYDILVSAYGDEETILPPEQSEYQKIESWTKKTEPYDLSLFNLLDKNDLSKNIDNIYSRFHKGKREIVVSTNYTFTFIADKIFNVMFPFVINSQLYACKQIKHYITARGFEKIAEGDFYKL